MVLDPFAGAASAGVAAARLGRRFVGIEINADFVEIGARRLAALSNNAALKDAPLNNGDLMNSQGHLMESSNLYHPVLD